MFTVGETVTVGANGKRGKIVEVYKPIGTYIMFKVHLFGSGEVVTASKHELVKGMPDEDFDFLFDNEAFPGISNSFNSPAKTAHTPRSSSATQSTPIPRVSSVTTSTPRDASALMPDSASTPTATNKDSYPLETNKNPITNKATDIPPESFTTTTNCINPTRSTPQVSSSVPLDTSKSVGTVNKPSRFVDMDEGKLLQFVSDQENKNTLKKTLSHIKLLREFLVENKDHREIHDIPAAELDKHLSKFFVCVRQKNGAEYQPSYLRGILGSIERYLKRHRYGHSLISGYTFAATREALASKQKDLKKQGLGNRPKAADRIEDHEIDTFYEHKLLGNSTPESLINTLWLNNTMYFGMRGGGEEHRALCWGDVKLYYDSETKLEYLNYNERQTKTRTGIDINNIRDSPPRMYATPDNKARCPVETYKVYSDLRPECYSEDNHPFYLATVTNNDNPNKHARWFLRGAIGKHKLENIMKTMVKKCQLPGMESKRLTNTSVRKHLCQKLLENNVPDTQAVHITGHKNAQSLNNYRSLSNQQKQKMSAILSNRPMEPRTPQEHSVNVPQNCQKSMSPTCYTNNNNEMHNSMSLCTNPENTIRSIFSGSSIYGGTFNISIHNSSGNAKRPRVIYDSD